MTLLQSLATSTAAVALFLFALQGFSAQLQRAGGARLRDWLEAATSRRWKGFAIGAGATALVQSSSAVTSLAATLVDARVMTLGGSLAVLLGANVGTTVTAWLVAFQLTGIGPFFLLGGLLMALRAGQVGLWGRAVFYFGLIFFALDLLSSGLGPLRDHPAVQEGLASSSSVLAAFAIGVLATAVLQSSSVVTGLVILLAQQQALPVEAGVAAVLGSNVGSTSTALIAGLSMRGAGRIAAGFNLAFNASASLLLLPAVPWIADGLADHITGPDVLVAVAHLGFNLAMAALFLPWCGRLGRWAERRWPSPEG